MRHDVGVSSDLIDFHVGETIGLMSEQLPASGNRYRFGARVVIVFHKRCDRNPQDAAVARSALGNAEVVSRTTPTISAEYALHKFGVKLNHTPAITQLPTRCCAQARSMPEAA